MLSRQQKQPSWIKRMLVDPDVRELNETIVRMKERAKERNEATVKVGNRPLYHDLYMEWLDEVLIAPAPTLHHKQFAVLFFLYTDSGYREYIACCENNIRRFNLFMQRLEIDSLNLTCGVTSDGKKYDLPLVPTTEDNHIRHCSTFVINMIRLACKL